MTMDRTVRWLADTSQAERAFDRISKQISRTNTVAESAARSGLLQVARVMDKVTGVTEASRRRFRSFDVSVGSLTEKQRNLLVPTQKTIGAIMGIAKASDRVPVSLDTLTRAQIDSLSATARTRFEYLKYLETMEKTARAGGISEGVLQRLNTQQGLLTTTNTRMNAALDVSAKRLQQLQVNLAAARSTAMRTSEDLGRTSSETGLAGDKFVFLQSAAQGTMLGMSLLQRNTMGVAFSLIFARFANVRIMASFAALTAVIMGAAGLVAAFKSLVSVANTAMRKLEDVGQRLSSFYGSVKTATAILVQADELSSRLGWGKDELVAMLDTLQKSGLRTETYITAILNASAATGKSASDLAKEFTDILKQEGDAQASSVKRFAQENNLSLKSYTGSLSIAEAMNKRFFKAAENRATTQTAQTEMMKNAWVRFTETVGKPVQSLVKSILPLITSLIDGMTQGFNQAVESAGGMEAVEKQLAETGAALRRLMPHVISFGRWLGSVIAKVVLFTARAIKVLADSINFLLRVLKPIIDLLKNLGQQIKDLFSNKIPPLVINLDGLWKILKKIGELVVKPEIDTDGLKIEAGKFPPLEIKIKLLPEIEIDLAEKFKFLELEAIEVRLKSVTAKIGEVLWDMPDNWPPKTLEEIYAAELHPPTVKSLRFRIAEIIWEPPTLDDILKGLDNAIKSIKLPKTDLHNVGVRLVNILVDVGDIPKNILSAIEKKLPDPLELKLPIKLKIPEITLDFELPNLNKFFLDLQTKLTTGLKNIVRSLGKGVILPSFIFGFAEAILLTTIDLLPFGDKLTESLNTLFTNAAMIGGLAAMIGMLFIGGFAAFFTTFTLPAVTIGIGVSALIIGLTAIVLGAIEKAFPGFNVKLKEKIDGFYDFVGNLFSDPRKRLTTEIDKAFAEGNLHINRNLKDYDDSLKKFESETLAGRFKTLGEAWRLSWIGFAATIRDEWVAGQVNIDNIEKAFKGWWDNGIMPKIKEIPAIWTKFWGDIGIDLQNAHDSLIGNWNIIATKFKTWWNTDVSPKIQEVIGLWNTFWSDIGARVWNTKNDVETFLGNLFTGISNWWNVNITPLLEGITTGWNKFWTDVGTFVETTKNKIFGWVDEILAKLSELPGAGIVRGAVGIIERVLTPNPASIGGQQFGGVISGLPGTRRLVMADAGEQFGGHPTFAGGRPGRSGAGGGVTININISDAVITNDEAMKELARRIGHEIDSRVSIYKMMHVPRAL